MQRYFSEFKWSDSKYPMSYPIPKIVELFENKIHTVENELRVKTVAYNDTKVQLTQAAEKEYSSFYIEATTVSRTLMMLLSTLMPLKETSSTRSLSPLWYASCQS